jgi:hypothetical protein
MVCQYYLYYFILFYLIRITWIETENPNLIHSEEQSNMATVVSIGK